MLAHSLLYTEMTGKAEQAGKQAALVLRLIMQTNHNITNHRHIVKQADVLESTGNALMIDNFLTLAGQILAIEIKEPLVGL